MVRTFSVVLASAFAIAGLTASFAPAGDHAQCTMTIAHTVVGSDHRFWPVCNSTTCLDLAPDASCDLVVTETFSFEYGVLYQRIDQRCWCIYTDENGEAVVVPDSPDCRATYTTKRVVNGSTVWRWITCEIISCRTDCWPMDPMHFEEPTGQDWERPACNCI